MREFDNRDIEWKVTAPTTENTALLRSTIDYIAKLYPPPLKVLDVGAKEGYSTYYFNKLGYDVIGTDIRNNFIEYAQEQDWNVIFDDMIDTKIKDKFDIVFMRHCLEHVRHERRMFRNGISLLKQGGVIIIQVPIETKSQYEAHARKKHLTYFPSLNSFKIDFLKSIKGVETVLVDMASNLGIETAGLKDIFYIGRLK